MKGADWLIGDVGARGEDLDAVETRMDHAVAAARLVKGIEVVSVGVRAIMTSGLSSEAVLLLVQNSAGYVKGNLIATSTIEKVLQAAATLDRRYLTVDTKNGKAKL